MSEKIRNPEKINRMPRMGGPMNFTCSCRCGKSGLCRLLLLLYCAACIFCTACADDSIIVMTAPDSTGLVASALPKNVRSANWGDISSWASSSGILYDEDVSSVCTWEQFFLFLWRIDGGQYADQSQFLDADPQWYRDRENALSYAVVKGLAEQHTVHQTSLYGMQHADAQRVLWHLSGEPAPLNKPHRLPAGMHEACELWACDIGLIVYEEQPFSDPSSPLSIAEAVTYLYYMEHRRSENSFPITVEEFLASCKNVTDMARQNGYRYGNSTAANPTTDGIISCDRLVAKALYDLGYTDQPSGGITCGNADDYLSEWGFERSTSLADARRGSILLVKHYGVPYTDHMFVAASDLGQDWSCDRYDCGSQVYIGTEQPISNVSFWYQTDNVIVYNIPG